MPSELELKILARLDALEKEVAALKKKVAAVKPAEVARRVPEVKKEVKADATTKATVK
jgi:hypothetical protein